MRTRWSSPLIAAAAWLVAGSGASAGALISATWSANIQGQGLVITNAGATRAPPSIRPPRPSW